MTRYSSVVPVADYEPPPVSTLHSSVARPILRRGTRPPLRAVPERDAHPETDAATAFADAALRGVLEVLDGRRPLTQLKPLLGERLVKVMFAMATPNGAGALPCPSGGGPLRASGSSLPSSLRASGSSLPSSLRASGSSAVLRKVRLRLVEPAGEAAEIFATYSRGERIRAIAGRIERHDVRGSRRWQLVAIQVG